MLVNCVHESSPTEPYPTPGSLLGNPMLTHLAPRDPKVLVDSNMPSDVELLVLADFDELCA